jgi:hypothetical protein
LNYWPLEDVVMPEAVTSSARVHRVTTRRRTLRPLICPLEPELLVAEFADELPPDVAGAVREHVAICDICGAQALALKSPYQLLATLGQAPVSMVPDLRETIQTQARSHPALRALKRGVTSLGRNGVLALTAILGLGLLVFFIAVVFLLPASAQTAVRSANGLSHPPAAGSSGFLYAETGKLVTVAGRDGTPWQVGEIIVTDQRNGVIVRSLPASDQALHVAQPDLLPIGIQVAGGQVAELTAGSHDGRQALIVFDASSGHVRLILPLTLPGNKLLPAQADALALSPDGSTAYVGIEQDAPTKAGVRVLVVDLKTGALVRTLNPGFNGSVPLPPPPGSLPVSGFPTSVPHLDAGGMSVAPGANGAMVISPDGQWLFDVLMLTDTSHGTQYAVVRRFSVTDGTVAQELGLAGAFPNVQLAASGSTHSPQIYLVRGSPVAEAFVMDASAQGPTLTGDIPLGGPVSSGDVTFSGTMSIAPTADGSQLYIGQDATRSDTRASSHDLWVVDTQGMSLLAHRSDPSVAGAPLPNASGNGKGGAFLLRDGQVVLMHADLSGDLVPWIRLSDGHAVVKLVAVATS